MTRTRAFGRTFAALLTLALGAGAATTARAQPMCQPCACDLAETGARGMPIGPVQAALLDGELGLARHACPRREVALGANGVVLADEPHFYGHVRLSGMLWASATLDPITELFLALEPVRYETVISSVDAESLGLGHVSLGITRAIVSVPDWVLSVSSRLVTILPGNDLYTNAWPFALDAMALFEVAATSWLRMHAHVGALASVAAAAGPNAPRAALLLGGGATWRPLGWLAFVLDLDASFGRADALDHFALAPAVRFAVARFGLELGALLPLAGNDRTLLAATIRLSYAP